MSVDGFTVMNIFVQYFIGVTKVVSVLNFWTTNGDKINKNVGNLK